MRRDVRLGARVWVSSLAVALLVTAGAGACGDDGEAAAPRPTTTAPAEDLDMKPTDFRSLSTMTKVRGFFVDNRLGHLEEALRVANSPSGGVYPVGTIIQLVPQEAMVKRRKGWSPKTNDWEFFFLSTSATGTEIMTARAGGHRESLRRQLRRLSRDWPTPSGTSCASRTTAASRCRSAATSSSAIQNADPRPR